MNKKTLTHQQSFKTHFSNDVSRLEQHFFINLNYQNIRKNERLLDIQQQFPLLMECDMRHRNS